MNNVKTTLPFNTLEGVVFIGYAQGLALDQQWCIPPRSRLYFDIRPEQALSCSFICGLLSSYLKQSRFVSIHEALTYLSIDKLSSTNVREVKKAVKRCVR